MHNNGWLDQYKPKSILIESVARSFTVRFGREIDWGVTLSEQQIKQNLFGQQWHAFVPELLIINTANYKLPLYNLLYSYSPNAFGNSDVYRLSLSYRAFSVVNGSALLIYRDDIRNLSHHTKEKLALANDNFNQLALMLREKGIALYVMPAVDKYDLYFPYIGNNPFPANQLFPILTSLPKEYELVNTKKILEPLVAGQNKDIFYADDTHWSYLAEDAIVQATNFL